MKRLLWIPALVAAALVYAAFDGDAGIRTWWRLGSDLRVARSRMDGIRSEIEQLRREAAALEGDPFAIERAIREDLRFARSGETVVRMPPSDPNARFP